MYRLVLLRHGQSEWNKEQRFNGWTDVDLSSRGVQEAKLAGSLLLESGYHFDVVYTSMLKRAIRTAWYVSLEMGAAWLPIVKSWCLNERHHGALEGLKKNETLQRLGEEQVLIWSRSYEGTPPPISQTEHDALLHDPRYHHIPEHVVPFSESLKDTVVRLSPYWFSEITPQIQQGKQVLIVGHNDSLRALVKILDGVSDEDIPMVNIPTGIPLIYELDDDFKPLDKFYLGEVPRRLVF